MSEIERLHWWLEEQAVPHRVTDNLVAVPDTGTPKILVTDAGGGKLNYWAGGSEEEPKSPQWCLLKIMKDWDGGKG